MTINTDDERYSFRLMDRSGVNRQFSGGSPDFNENDNERIYIEFIAHDQWANMKLYSEETYRDLIYFEERLYATASGPFRYPQIISSLGFGIARIGTAEYYTFLTDVLPENKTWVVTFQNGTVIDDLDSYDDATTLIDVLLGPDTRDPNPPSQGWDETGPFTRFQTRLYFLLIGFFMVFGPMGVWAMKRPSGYEMVIGAFIILIGFSLMFAAGQV